ncbi:MAG: T9SS type A sorting domain-containing protein [Bacteroidota bacterium]
MLPTIRGYPSPANDRLTIQIPTDLADVGYRGGIFSVTGTQVSSVRIAQGATQAQLFLGELSAGVYYLRLTPGVGEAFVKKIVIR